MQLSVSPTLSEVICPITEAKFTLVRKEIKENIDEFIDWTEDVISRADSGKYINISIDCEGFCLGSILNSLSCIQIGEIFNDTFNVKTDKDPPDVGSRPGFIILTPIPKEVKSSLSKALNHPNVMIYTFDCLGDFATIIESGVQLDMDNVFDSQLCTKTRSKTFISLKAPGLFKIVQKAKKLDPLGNKAEQEKNVDKKNYFKVSSYLLKDSKNPAQQTLSEDMLEIGSSDVYMTGLAAVYCIKNGFTETVLSQSKNKIDEFKNLAEKMNSILAAPILRHLFFTRNMNYDVDINLSSNSEDDLLFLLDHFQNLFYIINGYQILNDNFDCQTSLKRAKEVYLQIIKTLDSKKPELKEMLEKYS